MNILEKNKLPEEIYGLVKGLEYKENDLGMSDSKVYVFQDKVLKIEKVSEFTRNSVKIMKWLYGKLPCPEVLSYVEEENISYTLMTLIKGKMLCDEEFLNNPERLLDYAVKAIKLLWSVDIKDCPCCNNIDHALSVAEYNVENNPVDIENVESETFSAGAFDNPEALLKWLKENKVEEHFVFSHGDLSLPNIFVEDGKITGFIDLGLSGKADMWQDLAICWRSIKHNFEGKYNGGHPYPGINPDMLFEKLGVQKDSEKLKYFLLMDELF